MLRHVITSTLLTSAFAVALTDCGGESRAQPTPPDGSCKLENGNLIGGNCLYCPPARTDLSCLPLRTWARDPQSGVCCEYARPCAANFGWLTYGSAAECNPAGCSCELAIKGSQPLACGCPLAGGCPTFSQALSKVCDGLADIPVIESRGCGKIQLLMDGGTSGWQSTFDEQSGAMVGRSDGTDQQDGACMHFGYTFGEDFSCKTVRKCARCAEDFIGGAPACSD